MQYFVVMGNTRVGSTWFSASMNDLPGVFCTRELRWRMPYQDQVPPVHTYIDSTTRSVKERLDVGYKIAGAKGITAIGAKLKFDPYGYAPPAAFDHLGEVIEDDVEVIFLRRPYAEIYATWKAYGIRHLANPNATKRSRKKNLTEAQLDNANRFQTIHGAPLERKCVLLARDGAILAPLKENDGPQETISQSINDAIDDLLVLFYNDVLGLETIRNHPNVHHICYQDIQDNFYRIALKLGVDISAGDCDNVLKNASTSQIEKPGEQLVFPDAGLKEVSHYLDTLFGELRSGNAATRDIVRFEEDKNRVTFHFPGIDAVFAKHEETKGLAQRDRKGLTGWAHRMSQSSRVPSLLLSVLQPFSRPRCTAWFSHRAVHVPAAIAPKPTTWALGDAKEAAAVGK